MATYIVRVKALNRLVGMFVATSVSALRDIVDEEVNTEDCEYLVLKNGEGLMLDGLFNDAAACDEERDIQEDESWDDGYPIKLSEKLYFRAPSFVWKPLGFCE